MKIRKADIEHVAQLARLRFEEDELARFTHQLNSILTYMEQLNELDTSNVAPTTHAMDLYNVFCKDEVHESLQVDEVLANAPQPSRGSFQVPRIIE